MTDFKSYKEQATKKKQKKRPNTERLKIKGRDSIDQINFEIVR